MTPEQALLLIRQVAELAPVPKATHVQVEQAYALLAQALREDE